MGGLRFSEISWGSTLTLAIFRLLAASVVIGVPLSIMAGEALGLIMGPVVLAMCVAAAFLGGILDKMGVPVIGITVLFGFVLLIGDPLLWFISKYKPGLLPVDNFGIFNRPMVFVAKT